MGSLGSRPKMVVASSRLTGLGCEQQFFDTQPWCGEGRSGILKGFMIDGAHKSSPNDHFCTPPVVRISPRLVQDFLCLSVMFQQLVSGTNWQVLCQPRL